MVDYHSIGIGFAANLLCTKKSAPFVPTDQLGVDNKWVYDTMKRYYYWTDQIPGKPDYSCLQIRFSGNCSPPMIAFPRVGNRSTVGPSKTTAELFGFQYTLISHPFEAQQLAGVITLDCTG